MEAVFVDQGLLDSGQWHAVADVGSSGVEASGRAQGQEVSHGCLLPASGTPLSGTDPWLCRDMPLPASGVAVGQLTRDCGASPVQVGEFWRGSIRLSEPAASHGAVRGRLGAIARDPRGVLVSHDKASRLGATGGQGVVGQGKADDGVGWLFRVRRSVRAREPR